MTSSFPNVLFLTVDALRADRASVLGYHRPTTPCLERMAGDGLVCEQAVSPAAFTHICFPALMTSSRPLSHGGYDSGPVGRPPTVFEAFHDAGYETSAFCTTHWVSRVQGYDRGVDHEHVLFVLNTLPGLAIALFRSTLAAWHLGEVDDAVAVKGAEKVLLPFFAAVESYAANRLENAAQDRRDYPNARFVRDGYDFARVARLAAGHRREFDADPLAYLKRHLHYVPKAHEWIGREWRYFRRPGALFGKGLEILINRAIGLVNPELAALRAYHRKRYVDGADVTTKIIRQIENWDGKKPFFIWNHYQDTHIPYTAGYGSRWYRQTPEYLKALGYSPGIDVSLSVRGGPKNDGEWAAWSALYDAAVRFTDEQVGRIVEALERRGIAENTIVAVAGDHGEELGEHGDISHHFRLYSHNVRVPMLFYQKGLKARRITGLTDLLDIAPTLADMAGVPKPAGWEGLPVTDAAVAERRHLVLETFHGGNSLFENRPPYMAVRTHTHNFMWKEFLDPDDRFSPDGPELYDVVRDPDEQNNLYAPDHPLVAEFEAVIAERLGEIPEFGEDRLRRAFPNLFQPQKTKAPS
ncbi:MAG: sulfatase-like hydrolase/transferase [Proteobacteria bacterium]|nr:sulfatase-like hydrolase/transferase [Pseudomonadota bacterium]